MKNCVLADASEKVKRQLIEWERIVVNNISDKGLVPRICKELLQLNNKKITCLKRVSK